MLSALKTSSLNRGNLLRGLAGIKNTASSAISAHSVALNSSERFLSSPSTATDENHNEISSSEPPIDRKLLANIYNRQRSLYKKSVSRLRKQYFDEIKAQRERDAKLAAIEEAKFKRAVLERRRLKAIRTVENAKKQLERKEARRLEWEKELAVTQRLRDAKKELYQKARQKIVDELEAECHLWLTTPEEVEKALGNHRASQILWSRPGGMIGAPSGPHTAFGDDGDFWRYECHTWDARPTYKTPAQELLSEVEYISYLQANHDDEFWTREKADKAEKVETRARLRAIVREEGRRSLLNKQREMMRDIYGNSSTNTPDKGGVKLPPSAMPAPKLDYLADYEAQEREGVEILKRDPRRFFIFESDLLSSSNAGGAHASDEDSLNPDGEEIDSNTAASSITSLGRPVALRNPFFNNQPTAFPPRLGRDVPKDSRSEKEKKRDEREERMRAAAHEAALSAKKGMAYEVAMAAEEDLDDGSEDVDYDLAQQNYEKEMWEGKMEEWTDVDKKVFDLVPSMLKVTDEEIDWMMGELQKRMDGMEEIVNSEERMRRQELAASNESSLTVESLDDVDSLMMEHLGYDMSAMEELVKTLSPEQAEALEAMDFSGRVDITEESMAMEIKTVPGLTDEQVKSLVEFEMSLLKDAHFKKITKME